jgi:hypothetical protein
MYPKCESVFKHLKKEDLKPVRIIGISSLMTWQGLKAFELEHEGEDKDTMLADIINEANWRPQKIKDCDYPKRIPGIFWNKCYQLENMLIDLNQKEKIKASVLGLGVIYGKENSMLQTEFLRGLKGEELTIWGNGRNAVPLVHIETVLDGIRKLTEIFVDFAILKDSNEYTQ